MGCPDYEHKVLLSDTEASRVFDHVQNPALPRFIDMDFAEIGLLTCINERLLSATFGYSAGGSVLLSYHQKRTENEEDFDQKSAASDQKELSITQ